MDRKLNTIIESLGVYLPPQSVSSDDIVRSCKNKLHFPLEKITGIKSRRMAGEDEFSIDLATKAIANCMERSKYEPKDIDLLICCNISRYDGMGSISFEPCTSVKLRQEFGFTNALVFDITNACAGLFTGIYVVDAFIKAGMVRRGLVVSGEYITHLTKSAQTEIENFMDSRLACLTLGDGGAAIILEETVNHQWGFQELELQTFGRYSPYCIAKPSEYKEMIMYTDAVNLTDVAIKSGAKHSINLLQKADWLPDRFNHLIMHQTSKMTIKGAMRETNRLLHRDTCNELNTIINLEQRGNTASTSHFIATFDHILNHNINSGDKIVYGISASGLTVGTALYVFDDLPDRLRQTKPSQSKKPKESSAKKSGAFTRCTGSKVQIASIGTIPHNTCQGDNTMAILNQAAKNCLQQSDYQYDDIELIIYSGVYRSDFIFEPAYAAILAGDLDINATISGADQKKTFAFDLFNGSIGFLNACLVSHQMIEAGKCNNTMIAAAESENKDKVFPDQLGLCETASAVILEPDRSGNTGFTHFQFSYHEEFLDAYHSSYLTNDGQPYLRVEKNNDLEDLYIDCILPAVNAILQNSGLNLNRIEKIFPPQISSSFISRLSERLNIPPEKFVDVVGAASDLFSSSMPYALSYSFENKLVKSGDMGLIITVGSGIQVGCALYQF